MKPFKCPVCEGSGQVSPTLYNVGASGDTNPAQCRSCVGTGIVWSQEPVQSPVVWPHPPDNYGGTNKPWMPGSTWPVTGAMSQQ